MAEGGERREELKSCGGGGGEQMADGVFGKQRGTAKLPRLLRSLL